MAAGRLRGCELIWLTRRRLWDPLRAEPITEAACPPGAYIGDSAPEMRFMVNGNFLRRKILNILLKCTVYRIFLVSVLPQNMVK